MKARSLPRLLLAGGIVGAWFLAVPAFGQDAGKVQDLQRVIEAQQEQLEVQQKQLDEQRQLLRELQTQIESLAGDADREGTTAAAGKPQTPEKESDTQGAAATTPSTLARVCAPSRRPASSSTRTRPPSGAPRASTASRRVPPRVSTTTRSCSSSSRRSDGIRK